jgi:hypothetical protein
MLRQAITHNMPRQATTNNMPRQATGLIAVYLHASGPGRQSPLAPAVPPADGLAQADAVNNGHNDGHGTSSDTVDSDSSSSSSNRIDSDRSSNIYSGRSPNDW